MRKYSSYFTAQLRPVKGALKLSLLSSTMMMAPMQAHAQEAADADTTEEGDAIIVQGDIARTIQSSIETKRSLPVIGDAIVGDDIGDLPDLSVAETLERIVGVSADRFRGQSSEISIRGLGAFLGASYINGREISSGSDGRDVAFSQFPSELVNGAVVYKTQQAKFIEGGVSGVVELRTLAPLDFGKRRIQIQGQLGLSDYENRVVGGDDVSGRFTASYVDQFDLGSLGELGITVGGQIRRDTAPEDAFLTSSTFRPCNTIEGVDSSNNCSFSRDADGNPDGASETYLVSNQYLFRALTSQADRDAIVGSIQWRPSPDWEVNFDGQYSLREDVEERANLVIADGRRDITPIEISSQGALLAFTGESRIENQQVFRTRDEEFIGLGGNLKYDNGKFALAFDAAYSQTERRQDELDIRIRTNSRVIYQLDFRDVEVPALTFLDVTPVENNTGLTFDLNDHNIFTNGQRARRRLENVDDDILSFRLDGSYYLDGFFSSIDAGFRYTDRRRIRDDGIDNNGIQLVDSAAFFTPEAIAARQDFFPVQDFLPTAETGGISQGLTFATFDAQQLFTAITGSPDAGLPEGSTLSPEDADLTEVIYAGYLQANFDSEIFGKPASGNIGVRIIRTDTTSIGVSSALATMIDPNDPNTVIVTPVGDQTINSEENGFWNYLPSANVSFELSDDKILRLAAYRAIARPDQESLSAALDFDQEADLDDLADIVSVSGNPFLEPLTSWNADVSLEWYATNTSSLFLTAYYKRLQTGFETQVENLDLIVDGAPTTVLVGRSVNSDEGSDIFGFEISATHQFDYLPSPLDGFGFQANYNFADSNFEFPDPTVVAGEALADFTTPANISGFSRHTANANIFYEKGPVSTRLAYRYRSEFFRPFRNSSNRFNEGNGFLDFSASMNLMKGVQARFQVLNLTDEPIIQNRPVNDSRAEASFTGRRYFVGLRARF